MNPRREVVREYSRLASIYDGKWSSYVEATTRETVRRVPSRPTDRILDVGCGTGALLHCLASVHPPENLVGIDPVAQMRDRARRKLPSPVELREAWAESLPFDDGAFDVVLSCNMFHYLPDPPTALREMSRVLRPGGRLVVTDWCDDFWACRLCDLYLRLTSRTHVRTYRLHECARMLAMPGHTLVGIDRYKIDWLWGMMTATVIKDEHPAP